MTAKELLGIGIRLLGIWLIVKSFTSFSSTISYSITAALDEATFNELIVASPYLLTAIIMAIVGYFFIKFPYFIAAKLIPSTGLDNTQIDWEEKLIERIGFVLLGAYILSWAIPDIIHNTIELLTYNDTGSYEGINLTTTKINTFITLVEIGIGMFLLLGSRGLVNLIHKLRS